MAAPAFRRPTDPASPPLDAAPEDLEHLLDAIPEVPAARGGDASPPPATGLHDVLEQVRHHMESAFGDGLARVEGSLGALTRDTEARMQAAQASLKLARAELERARADYERKAAALRELKKTLESL